MNIVWVTNELVELNKRYRITIANFHNQLEGDTYPYESALIYFKDLGRHLRSDLSRKQIKEINTTVSQDMARYNRDKGLFNMDII